MSVKNIVIDLLKPLEAKGYEVWNVEYAGGRGEKQLRVFVDKEGGIGVNDCEIVSRFLSEKLDQNDPISEAYSLVVSSPGMDRQLIKDEHFARYLGQAVEVALYSSYEGRKKFAALLGRKTVKELFVTPIDRNTFAPECGELSIPGELVSKVNLLIIM